MQTDVNNRTSFFSGLITWQKKVMIESASINELEINEMKKLRIKGKSIILCRTENGYFAFQERCSFGGFKFSDGVMIKSTVQCLRHGCQFSVETGIVKKGPANKALKTYKTYIKNGMVYIEI